MIQLRPDQEDVRTKLRVALMRLRRMEPYEAGIRKMVTGR